MRGTGWLSSHPPATPCPRSSHSLLTPNTRHKVQGLEHYFFLTTKPVPTSFPEQILTHVPSSFVRATWDLFSFSRLLPCARRCIITNLGGGWKVPSLNDEQEKVKAD